MARPIRIELPGAVHHVMARGSERKSIFRDDEDRSMWLKTLAGAAEWQWGCTSGEKAGTGKRKEQGPEDKVGAVAK
jgi:hypothetical protein